MNSVCMPHQQDVAGSGFILESPNHQMLAKVRNIDALNRGHTTGTACGLSQQIHNRTTAGNVTGRRFGFY